MEVACGVDVNLSLEELVVSSLQVLGWESFDTYKDMKVQVDPKLFKKANTKALYSLVYFLFGKLVSQEQMNAFLFCWPPRTAEMKREFKSEAFKLIKKLEDDKKIPPNTIVGKSILDMGQGERVWLLLKTLSDSAFKFLLSTEYPWKKMPPFPLFQEYLSKPDRASRKSVVRMKNSMLSEINQEVHTFSQVSKETSQLHEQWLSHSSYLTQQHKEARNKLDKLTKLEKKEDPNTQLVNKLAALDRGPQIDMMKYIWSNIERIYQQSQANKGTYSVKTITDSQYKRRLIDLGEGKVKVHSLVQEWSSEIQEASSSVLNQETQGIGDFAQKLSCLVKQKKEEHLRKLQEIKNINLKLQQQIEELTSYP